MFNIIGDIAGNFITLQALLAKMPRGHLVSVGDVIDRGPRSKQVVEFFLHKVADRQATVLYGNHEDMLVDACRGPSIYYRGCWVHNGGNTTLQSFGFIDPSVVNWLAQRPISLKVPCPSLSGDILAQSNTLLISHSFIPKHFLIDTESSVAIRNATKDTLRLDRSYTDKDFEKSWIWNRENPIPIPNMFQICGHNSQMGHKIFCQQDVGEYAVCLDSSRSRLLTGLHISRDGKCQFFSQEFID
jgi:hypothetical protein